MPLLCRPVPTIKSLDEAAGITGVPRRTLQRWLNEGKLTPWTIEGDRRRFVDIAEIEKLRQPRPDTAARTSPDVPVVQPPVAMAVIVRDGLLLMAKRRFREPITGSAEPVVLWSFPSGEVEPNETPEAAAVREVAEELGVAVRALARISERIHPRSPSKRRFIYVACELAGDEPAIVDHEELSELRWCTLEEAVERAEVAGGFDAPVLEYLERTLTSAPR